MFLIGRFSNIFSSDTTRPNVLKLYRNDDWKVLYKDSSFRNDWATNMVAMVAHSFALKSMGNCIVTFYSETAKPIPVKVCMNDV